MLAHHGVDKDHKVYMADGPPQTSKEKKTTVGKALQAVRKAGARAVTTHSTSRHGITCEGTAALQEDFEVLGFRARTRVAAFERGAR